MPGGSSDGSLLFGGGSSDEIAWCAAGACSLLSIALLELVATLGEAHVRYFVPCGYRASVAELVADARLLGRWIEITQHPACVPTPGDFLVSRRLGEDPRWGGRGHVEIVESCTDAIGGNESNTWERRAYLLADTSLVVGWIAVSAPPF